MFQQLEEAKLPQWVVHIEPADGSGHGSRERRVRAKSREAAEASVDVDRKVWNVWASWKCDCGC